MPKPDPTGKIGLPPDVGDCVTLFRLAGQVCNRGIGDLASGFPATFYLGDPRLPGPRPACTAHTMAPTLSGQCQSISCDWDNPPPPPYDLWLRVDDDGQGGHPIAECKDGNDTAHIELSTCPNAPG